MRHKPIVGQRYIIDNIGGLRGSIVRVKKVSLSEKECECEVLLSKRSDLIGRWYWFFTSQLRPVCIFSGGKHEYSK